MPAIIDLTGHTYNRWTVMERDFSKKGKGTYWFCRCSCGTIKSISSNSLRSGSSKSCGCLQKEAVIKTGHNNAIDLTNQRFGKLKVLYKANHVDNNTSVYWICQCDCGKITKPISAQNLRNGDTKSCGCMVSKGNDRLCSLLKELNIDFQSEYSFDDLKGDKDKLRFDFVVFDKNKKILSLIEYQGKQHYEPQSLFGGEEKFLQQQRYDKIKRDYCKEHDIQLIEIPYWDYEKLSVEYLKDLLFV